MPLLLFLSIFCISCNQSRDPSERLQYKKSVEWVHLQKNGDIFVSRWSQGNTGLFKKQGHHSVYLWQKGQSDINAQFHAPHNYVQWNTQAIWTALPSADTEVFVVGNSHSTLSPHSNTQTNSPSLHLENQTHYDDWNLRLYGTWNPPTEIVYTTSTTTKKHPQEISDTNKAVSRACSISSADIGWLQVGKQSIMLEGSGMIIERETTNTIAYTHSVYVFAHEFQLYIDTVDDTTWGSYTQNNTLYVLDNASITQQKNSLDITLPITESPTNTIKIHIEMQPAQLIGTEEPFSHITTLEKTLLSSQFSFSNIFWYKQKSSYTIQTSNNTTQQANVWVITKTNMPKE